MVGAGAGGFVGSSIGSNLNKNTPIGGGGFVKPGSGSSLSKPIGGGGFVQPKPAGTSNLGSGFSNNQLSNTGSNFGSSGNSFGSTGSSFGNSLGSRGNNFGSSSGSSFGSNIGGSSFGNQVKPSKSSNLMNMAGAGLAGGVLGGAMNKGFSKNKWGVNQYSGYSKPKKSWGSRLFGKSNKKYGYKTPGYGTNWGTNFAGGIGKYGGKEKKGISKKALG